VDVDVDVDVEVEGGTTAIAVVAPRASAAEDVISVIAR
jgi:hypothetical protein